MLYLDYSWLVAGWGKITDPAWTGEQAGVAVKGFMEGALSLVEAGDVPTWYAWFLEAVVIPNAVPFSYMVAWGEVVVGLGLFVGFLTGIAAFFGALMKLGRAHVLTSVTWPDCMTYYDCNINSTLLS